jgi:para-nitrobenzyl esterase
LKSDQGAAPVWKYFFSWQSRVREGRLGAYHCIDIPFAFNNVDECASMLGADEGRYALASRMSGAFTQFARTGNPNIELLPKWEPFERNTRAMMRMDDTPELLINAWQKERDALSEIG